MIRVVFLLATETAALGAMLALRIDLPWTDPKALLSMPEHVVAAGIVRTGAIVIVSWLLVSTLAYAAAAPTPRLRRAVGRVTAPLVRRIVDTALAATLSLTVATPAVATEAPPEPIVITVEESSSGHTVIVPPGVTIPTPAPDPAVPPSPPTRSPGPSTERITIAAPIETAMFTGVLTQVVEPQTYVVERGDHLWSIAEQTLMLRTGRILIADHEIAPFWRELIELNRSSLRSGDPDLIYPGETLTIPETT